MRRLQRLPRWFFALKPCRRSERSPAAHAAGVFCKKKEVPNENLASAVCLRTTHADDPPRPKSHPQPSSCPGICAASYVASASLYCRWDPPLQTKSRSFHQHPRSRRPFRPTVTSIHTACFRACRRTSGERTAAGGCRGVQFQRRLQQTRHGNNHREACDRRQPSHLFPGAESGAHHRTGRAEERVCAGRQSSDDEWHRHYLNRLVIGHPPPKERFSAS